MVMFSRLSLSGLLHLALLASIAAYTPVHAQDSKASRPATSKYLLRGSAVPVVPVAAWQANGKIETVEGKNAVGKAPPAASRYELKNYVFPSGTIRVFSYKKGNGGLLRQITDETELYVFKGSAEVDVAGRRTAIGAGDAVNRPGGILRTTADEDALIVAYTVGSTVKDPKSVVLRGKDVAFYIQLAQWVRDGKTIASKTPEEFAKAPPDAQIHLSKRYEFDGNSLRVPVWKKGAATIVGDKAVPTTIQLVYIFDGHSQFTYNGIVDEVYGGDAIEEEAGIPHSWVLHETMRFIVTDGLK
ncbi:MAG: hypothetical protein ACYCZX_16080 [Rhodospirillaceae bacterium]